MASSKKVKEEKKPIDPNESAFRRKVRAQLNKGELRIVQLQLEYYQTHHEDIMIVAMAEIGIKKQRMIEITKAEISKYKTKLAYMAAAKANR